MISTKSIITCATFITLSLFMSGFGCSSSKHLFNYSFISDFQKEGDEVVQKWQPEINKMRIKVEKSGTSLRYFGIIVAGISAISGITAQGLSDSDAKGLGFATAITTTTLGVVAAIVAEGKNGKEYVDKSQEAINIWKKSDKKRDDYTAFLNRLEGIQIKYNRPSLDDVKDDRLGENN